MWFRKKTNKPFIPTTVGAYTVKAVAPADWQDFRAFYLRMLKEQPLRSPDTYQDLKSQPREYWQNLIEQAAMDPSSFLGCTTCQSGAYAGLIHLQGRTESKRNHESEVKLYVVDDQVADRDLQQDIWNRVLEYLQADGVVNKVVVGVPGSDDEAMRLYNDLGFERFGYDDRYQREGNDYLAAILLVKHL